MRATIEPVRAGGANYVFRAGDVLVRVAQAGGRRFRPGGVDRWLVAEGFPVAAPLADPEVVEGATVSMWEYVRADPERAVDFEQLGDVVARLHRVDTRLREVVALPVCGNAAWLEMDRSLDRVEACGLVDAAGMDALSARRSDLVTGAIECARAARRVSRRP